MKTVFYQIQPQQETFECTGGHTTRAVTGVETSVDKTARVAMSVKKGGDNGEESITNSAFRSFSDYSSISQFFMNVMTVFLIKIWEERR